MCGIAGELRLVLGERARADRVRAMCDVMVHRGPDDEGLLAHAEVALGMRRLSIVDVSGGQQPLANEDGSVQVVCNGEIYNSALLRSALEARGHRFRSRSDVEVIAHLYEEEGVDAVGRLEGMFALALWDARRHRLLLARDRLGIKPLYLAETPRGILFGSEAKCLLAGGLEPVIDPQALHDYLTLGYVPDPTSIFVGARQLPAAHLMVAEPGDGGGRVRVERYWSLAGHAEARAQRGEAEWQGELARTLRAAVESHLMSDVPLGVFRSGGLDSGSIFAFMHGLGVHPIRTFTIGFEESSYSEVDLARQVATRFGTEHHELIVRPDAAALLPKLVHHFGEPFADSTAIPTWYVSQLARQHVKVVLCGEGGDEILAGYETYRARRFAALYGRLPRPIGGWLVPGIPPSLRLRHLRTKYMLRRAMAGRLPEPILRQRKLGFNLPLAGWLAGALRDFAQDVLAPSRLRRQGLLDAEAVGRLLSEHVRREKDHSRAIWALLFLVVWHDEIVSGSRPAAAALSAREIDR